MLSKFVSFFVIVASVATSANSLDLDFSSSDLYDEEGRLLVIPVGGTATTTGLSLNITTLAALASVLASGLVTLLGLGALGFLLYSLFAGGYGGSGYGSGSGGYGGNGGYSSYSSYRRSFDPYAIDWEKFSILDWIAIGEEAWRKFDPADLECQKRLICEIHQNTSRFGSPAARLVDLFSYLQYAEVLSLPDEIKALIEDYNDAADRGRSLQKECGEIYQTCDFSVKKIMDKYSHNEV
ncbi:uncharacterized protein [Penaeus vannamei]|uniref:Uncharacterized protein n=1 Tax=Penaeus vannamei TaxID=6689 RepID=A0A423S9K6_PENVA|nr:uncharacterized protein LOC113827812 isoform X1 [Penaeus vannamei]ROT60881.1 hypothetical protein C7M84_021479 [Penaeus vannamei]